MYIRTSNRLADGPLDYGLSGPGGCWPDPATNGKSCWFQSKHGGGKTAVYIPDAAAGLDPLTCLVWIHGDIIPCCDETRDPVSYVRSTQFPLVQQLADNKLPFVLVTPSMNWHLNNKWHVLGSPKSMNAFLEEVRTGLTHAGWSPAPKFNRLILAGHSRAYVVFNALARQVGDEESKAGALGDLSDVWLLDTTYGEKQKQAICATWINWARIKSHVKLQVFYREGTATAAVAKCIGDSARSAGLSNVTVKEYHRCLLSHCDMPRNIMPDLLASSNKKPAIRPR